MREKKKKVVNSWHNRDEFDVVFVCDKTLLSFGKGRINRQKEEKLVRIAENFCWTSTMRWLTHYATLLTLVCHFFNFSQYFSFHCRIVTNICPGSTYTFLLS